MKYLQSGGFRHHPLMRLTLGWTLVFLAGLWITNAYMYLSRMSLRPSSIQAYYLGTADEFARPRSVAAMAEVTHAHLPMMALVLLLLTHLMIFAPYSERRRRWLISSTFLSALLGEASGWLVRFVHPAFAWLKAGSFLAFQGLLAFLLLGLAAYLRSGAGRR